MKIQNIKTKLLFSALFSSTLYFNPFAIDVAMACKCSGPISTVRNAVNQTTSAVNTQGSNIVAAILKHQTTSIEALGQAVGGINTSISDNTRIAGEDRAKNAQFDKIHDVINSRPQDINCGNAGSGSVPTGASVKGSGTGGAYSGYEKDKTTNISKAQKAAGFDNKPPKLKDIPPNDAYVFQVGAGYCSQFAGEGDAVGQMCNNAGFKPKTTNVYANAHIDGATLLSGPKRTDDGGVVKRNSITPNSDDHKALVANMHLLFETKATPTLPKSQLESGAGRSFLGVVQKWLASKNLAKQIAMNQESSFLVDPNTVTALNHIKKTDSDWLASYLNDFPGWEKGVSASMMRDIEVDRRGANPRWATDLTSMDDAGRMTEALFMQAKQMQMQRDMIEEVKTTNLLLAKILEGQSDLIYKEAEYQRERAIAQSSALTANVEKVSANGNEEVSAQ